MEGKVILCCTPPERMKAKMIYMVMERLKALIDEPINISNSSV
jgi:hypothetical protein